MHRLLVPIFLAGALALSACGSSNDESKQPASAPAAGRTVKLQADGGGGLYFEQRKLKAKAGVVTLVMDNPSSSGKPHGIAIEGNGVDKDGQIVQPGSKSTVTVTLKAGTYEYYCPVPAHKAAGMKGTLTVR